VRQQLSALAHDRGKRLGSRVVLIISGSQTANAHSEGKIDRKSVWPAEKANNPTNGKKCVGAWRDSIVLKAGSSEGLTSTRVPS